MAFISICRMFVVVVALLYIDDLAEHYNKTIMRMKYFKMIWE